MHGRMPYCEHIQYVQHANVPRRRNGKGKRAAESQNVKADSHGYTYKKNKTNKLNSE